MTLERGVYAYRFTVEQRPVYVPWYDDSRRFLPGDSEPTVGVKVPLPRGEYRLTETPTGPGAAPSRIISVAESGWSTELGCTPIFLEPAAEH